MISGVVFYVLLPAIPLWLVVSALHFLRRVKFLGLAALILQWVAIVVGAVALDFWQLRQFDCNSGLSAIAGLLAYFLAGMLPLPLLTLRPAPGRPVPPVSGTVILTACLLFFTLGAGFLMVVSHICP